MIFLWANYDTRHGSVLLRNEGELRTQQISFICAYIRREKQSDHHATITTAAAGLNNPMTKSATAATAALPLSDKQLITSEKEPNGESKLTVFDEGNNRMNFQQHYYH